MKTIKVGAEGVSIFLGDGLAAYDIDDDIATYMSDHTLAMVLAGRDGRESGRRQDLPAGRFDAR